jgi:hypothetical protein
MPRVSSRSSLITNCASLLSDQLTLSTQHETGDPLYHSPSRVT